MPGSSFEVILRGFLVLGENPAIFRHVFKRIRHD
jgi:hypothetical protein